MDTYVDDDPSALFLIAAFISLLSLPLLLVLIITSWIAYSKTRAFQKSKLVHPSQSLPLIEGDNDSESDSELDPNDSGDEAVLKIREEKRRDMALTSSQYFWNQFRVCWRGDANMKYAVKVKEREERRKLAKEVARELRRMERRGLKKGYSTATDVTGEKRT